MGGSLIALGEFRVKKLVAYSTLSQIGIATMTFGLGQLTVGYYHLISHGFLKALLFIGVGTLIHSGYGQQEVRKNFGSPCLWGFTVCSISFSLFSLSGLMFTRGIVSKEILLSLYSSSVVGILFYV